ncbi:glycosyltransferase family 4 protein [bacterium]|nr:MAG: glycosyltransferase family 4 protein [bacterium]
MTKTKMPRTLVLHNVVSPYRIPVFDAVHQKTSIEVWFTRRKTADRHWDTSLAQATFPARILKSWLIGPVFLNPTLLWNLMRHPFDIYLVGDFPETALATFTTIFWAKIRRKPVIMWSETTDNEVLYFQNLVVSANPLQRRIHQGLTWLAAMYRRVLLSLPDHFVALSDDAKTFLEEQGIHARFINSGPQVMPEVLLPRPTIARRRGGHNRPITFLYLGYLNPAKGIDELVRVVKQLPADSCRLVIVGSGPADAMLRTLAAGHHNIQFAGYVADSTEKANYYTRADCLVLPTLGDCWGLVINEALHYGTAVITTTAAAGSQVLRPFPECIIAPRDPHSLLKTLKHFLEHPDRLRTIGQWGSTQSTLTSVNQGAKPLVEAINTVWSLT